MAKQKYFRQVERLLYDYKYLDQAIENLTAELETIMPQASTSVVKLGQGSTKTPFDTSQTERWGIKRAESKLRARLLKKRRHRKAIKAAREQLTDEENTFIWLKYDLEKTHRETRNALKQITVSMSESTYFRLRQKTLKKIAKFMGVI